MNRKLRTSIFLVFITFFVIVAPLSVLYTAGYRYNPKNGSIVRTGGISVSTSPRNAMVFLNDELQEKRTPFIFKRIIPGTYNLTISKDGYHDWSGEIEVKNSQTTEVNNVTLLESVPIQQTFITGTTEIRQSHNGATAAYIVSSGGWQEVWVYETKNDRPKLVDRINNDTLNLSLTWSKDDQSLLVLDTENQFLRIYRASGNTIAIEDALVDDFLDAFWSSLNDEILYIQQEQERFTEIDINTNDVNEIDATSNELRFRFDDQAIMFVDNGSQIELQQIHNEKASLIALLPRANYQIEERDDNFLFIVDDRNTLTIVDVASDQPIVFSERVTAFDWYEETKNLVYTNGFEINLFQTSNSENIFITRQSETIEHVAWHDTGRIIFFATETNITATETYPVAQQRYTTYLGSMQNIKEFWIQKNGDIAYIYGTQDGADGFYSLPLTR